MSISHSARLSVVLTFCATIVCAAQTPSTPVYTVIADMPANSDFTSPCGGHTVQSQNGGLYTTTSCGVDAGTLFSFTSGGSLTAVYELHNYPNGGLTLGTDGNFYGTDLGGAGGNNCPYGCGEVFKVTPLGAFTPLYDFTGGTDGSIPLDAPVQLNDVLYGTAAGYTPWNGNQISVSTIWSLTSTGTFKVLHTFSGADGSYAQAPLVVGPDGNLYGGTLEGGANNLGVLFKITPSGTYTVLHNFAGGSDGNYLASGMTAGRDGNLYGVANKGGANGLGVIFKLTTSGTYTALNQLSNPPGNASESLVQGSDGKFYGVLGQVNGSTPGAIYSVTSTGTLTILYTFCQQTNCADGINPSYPLVQYTDGKFYGFTYQGGGSNNDGVFFSLSVGLGAFANLLTTSGGEAAKVQIEGQGFSSSSVVKFGGTQSTSVTASGTTFLTATVPAGALTGTVTVTTGTTTLTSPQTFKVKPGVKSFSPTSGPVGTAVTITGTELTQATKVTFNGTSATFTVNSDSQITATVPARATSGKITVMTKGGSASSTTSFTVN